jgi:hypothetical protein
VDCCQYTIQSRTGKEDISKGREEGRGRREGGGTIASIGFEKFSHEGEFRIPICFRTDFQTPFPV